MSITKYGSCLYSSQVFVNNGEIYRVFKFGQTSGLNPSPFYFRPYWVVHSKISLQLDWFQWPYLFFKRKNKLISVQKVTTFPPINNYGHCLQSHVYKDFSLCHLSHRVNSENSITFCYPNSSNWKFNNVICKPEEGVVVMIKAMCSASVAAVSIFLDLGLWVWALWA